ncbi:spore coat protein [Devosia limi DSM 17137]|uniref:Spore coat protein n=1 Tax=Devosia limi DSM 17137 TaxID=1121477 RepID=A0A0F5LAU2_9HYPH|nr:UDP-4-amino-4,6-dideoxy-N-acetyl-beta-L-altrosamine transaminase [Devosia limi]KKB79405.1 spore coat protein [Devosia limi DSM 17137]SHF32000.1 UDP-4-amino-4,6-dideoxy-N-acetyl-beta-L-altrosamine transaminase [Devosia limi DSM 17137]
MIPYGRQSISEADIAAVVDVLRSDFLTQGPAIPKFEQAMCAKVGAQYGVAVNSATSGLHIACLALGLGPDDLLWTVPNTFVASANCARYCGADVDFVDIDPVTQNISVTALAEKLRTAERLPKIVVPVHFSGQPCDMKEIAILARQYGFKIIEDASHAVGATYFGEPVGSCQYSDIAIFSFHPVKIITSGEGGLALTNDAALAEAMVMLRSHGITRDATRYEQPDRGPWYYEQQMLGYNYRMIDIEAALGLSQLGRLDAFIARRNQLAARYDDLLSGLDIQKPKVLPNRLSSFHLYVVRLTVRDADRHRRVFEKLRADGVGVNVHYTPVHLQPDFQRLGFAPGDFPEAERHGATAISLPMYADLSDEAQLTVVNSLINALGE